MTDHAKYTASELQPLGPYSDSTGVLIRDARGDALYVRASGVPADGAAGYAKGCLLVDLSSGDTVLYTNTGGVMSCTFAVAAGGPAPVYLDDDDGTFAAIVGATAAPTRVGYTHTWPVAYPTTLTWVTYATTTDNYAVAGAQTYAAGTSKIGFEVEVVSAPTIPDLDGLDGRKVRFGVGFTNAAGDKVAALIEYGANATDVYDAVYNNETLLPIADLAGAVFGFYINSATGKCGVTVNGALGTAAEWNIAWAADTGADFANGAAVSPYISMQVRGDEGVSAPTGDFILRARTMSADMNGGGMPAGTVAIGDGEVVSAPVVSCAYPLDDDGTAATSFGMGWAEATAPDYQTITYTYTDAQPNAFAIAAPALANWGTQAIVVPGGEVMVMEAVVASAPAQFEGIGLYMIVLRSGAPIGQAYLKIGDVDGGTPTITYGDGAGTTVARVAATADFRLGVEFDGTTGVFTFRTTDGLAGTYTIAGYTAGDAVVYAFGIDDGVDSPTNLGQTCEITLVSASPDMALTYTAGATDTCGNAV
jgi:hypothetical protein